MFLNLLILFMSILVVGIFFSIIFISKITKGFSTTQKKMEREFNAEFHVGGFKDFRLNKPDHSGFEMQMPSAFILVFAKICSLSIYIGLIGMIVTAILKIIGKI